MWHFELRFNFKISFPTPNGQMIGNGVRVSGEDYSISRHKSRRSNAEGVRYPDMHSYYRSRGAMATGRSEWGAEQCSRYVAEPTTSAEPGYTSNTAVLVSIN